MAEKNPDQKGGRSGDAADLIHVILKGMQSLDDADRQRVLTAVNAYFDDGSRFARRDVSGQGDPERTGADGGRARRRESADRDISPEDFIEEKRPQNDVQRIVCLGYYLSNFRDQPEFKTKDLTELNNEASQPKIGNPTMAAKNAYTAHLLVQAGKGQRKLSSYGKKFVEALPDQAAARALKADLPTRRRARKKKSAQSSRKRS